MGQETKISAARETDRLLLEDRAEHVSSNGRRSLFAEYQHTGIHRIGSGHLHPVAYALPIRVLESNQDRLAKGKLSASEDHSYNSCN